MSSKADSNSDIDPANPNALSDVDGPVNEPMTPGLMARLFAVPLVIVSVIVGCAVLVVIFFGDIVSEPERSISQLVEILERPTGGKVGGLILLPQDKESWQAARELAIRLTRPDVELKDEDRAAVVRRLGAIIERDASDLPDIADEKRREMSRQRLGFLMTSLCRTGERESVPFVVGQLGHADAVVRRDAVIALSYLPDPSVMDPFIEQVTARLRDEAVEVRLVACAALTKLVSDASRSAGVEALAGALVDPKQEVQWNAALTLARLGDGRGKTILLDLLDRSFWETRVQYEPTDPAAAAQGLKYDMPEGRVSESLKAAIDAGSNLQDSTIWASIESLRNDKDPGVAGAAMKALEERDKRNDTNAKGGT